MKATRMAPTSLEEAGPRQKQAKVVACGHCHRRLADEFFFTCVKCEASYCYIHMSRHQAAACSRLLRRNRREEAADSRIRVEKGQASGEGDLLLNAHELAPNSSANV